MPERETSPTSAAQQGVMAYIDMAYLVMAHIVMAHVVMAHVVMGHVVMAHIGMAYIVMAHIAERDVTNLCSPVKPATVQHQRRIRIDCPSKPLCY